MLRGVSHIQYSSQLGKEGYGASSKEVVQIMNMRLQAGNVTWPGAHSISDVIFKWWIYSIFFILSEAHWCLIFNTETVIISFNRWNFRKSGIQKKIVQVTSLVHEKKKSNTDMCGYKVSNFLIYYQNVHTHTKNTLFFKKKKWGIWMFPQSLLQLDIITLSSVFWRFPFLLLSPLF